MTYHQSRNKLLSSVNRLESDLFRLRQATPTNDFIIARQEAILKSIKDFIEIAEQYLDDSIDSHTRIMMDMRLTIMKQALIIKAAKVSYPTVNQDIRTIQDCYFASTDQFSKVGQHTIDHIEIDVI